MKLRSLENMAVLLENTAETVGVVKKGVIGDDFRLAYVVVETLSGEAGIIRAADLKLGPRAVVIFDPGCIKSYAHGEESSMYDRKIGDNLFNADGEELGILSDFVIDPEKKWVKGVEVSAGVFKDMLEGRKEMPLQGIRWVSDENAIISQEGSELR